MTRDKARAGKQRQACADESDERRDPQRRGGWCARRETRSRSARRRQHDERQETGGARNSARRDNNCGREAQVDRNQPGKSADAQEQREYECRRSVRAEPAVPHDFELALGRRTAAEPVAEIGETVLVHRAGDEDEEADGDCCGEPWCETEVDRERQNERLRRHRSAPR